MADGYELQFDVISYVLISLLLGIVILPVVLAKDPDIHPFALYRQSSVAPVRNPKESAVHRSLHTPFGYPLVTGLGLPAEQKYSTRNGDIRDIWKLASEKGNGKLLSIKGVDVKTHDLFALTKDIHALGTHLKSLPDVKKVAVYLPNDVENLVASFACAFYDLTLILLPFDPNGIPSINALLKQTAPDVLIAPGGLVPLSDLEGVALKELIFVVEAASSHLDFSSPDTSTTTLSEITSKEGIEPITDLEIDLTAPAVVICGPPSSTGVETVTFSHRNIVAAVASLTTTLPKPLRYTPDDVFVPVDSLADLFTRTHLYTALLSGATIALNPIAGRKADLATTVKNVNPTVVVASPETLHAALRLARGNMIEWWHRIVHWFQLRTLAAGQIPKGSFWTRVNDYSRPEVGSNLRLVFTAESAGEDDTQILSESELNQLRAHLQTRVVYGLKSHKVAGPVTMWSAYDYRVRGEEDTQSQTHFGGVVPALEVKLLETEGGKKGEDGRVGEIHVAGTTVGGGVWETKLGVVGRWDDEGVLGYAG